MSVWNRWAIVVLCVAMAWAAGCVRNSTDLAGSIVDTPIYSENRLFYLETLRSARGDYGELSSPEKTSADTSGQRAQGNHSFVSPQFSATTQLLQHPYEWVPGFEEREIKEGDSISVVLKGVRMPEDLGGRRDVAVVLDIATTPGEEAKSLVIYYQRGVHGGQMLNCSELLVFSQSDWDGSPPYFRVRVIDVNAEARSRARAMLDGLSDFGGSLGGLMPHPVLPIVNAAAQAADLVLRNSGNKMIIDFQVQLYPMSTNRASGSELTALRTGSWMILGRPMKELPSLIQKRPMNEPALLMPGRQRRVPYVGLSNKPLDATLYEEVKVSSLEPLQASRVVPEPGARARRASTPSDVWRENMVLDRRTGQVLRWEDGHLIPAPYLTLTIADAEHGVSKEILDRTAEVLAHLKLARSEEQGVDRLESAIDALKKAVEDGGKPNADGGGQ